MNLEEITACVSPYVKHESTFVSEISEILRACQCSKSLMISIYLIEKSHFLYCNNGLKKILGENCTALLKEGWVFWFSRIDHEELGWVKDKFTEFFTTPYSQDLLNLRYHIFDFLNRRICIKHEIMLHKIAGQTLAINYFLDVTDKERIEHYFEFSEQRNTPITLKEKMPISAREKEVLQLIANGYSSKEIANMLFISNHTAISHRKNLIEKFKVKNTAHLIKKASRYSYF